MPYTDIKALHGINFVGGFFIFYNNTSLCNSKVDALLDEIGEENIGGDIGISYQKDC